MTKKLFSRADLNIKGCCMVKHLLGRLSKLLWTPYDAGTNNGEFKL